MGSSPERQGRSRSKFRRRGRILAAGVGAAALVLVAGACSSTGSSGASGAPVKGGTAVMAEFPSSPPNYVFPFMNSTYASNSNIFDLQWLMYRPLYWFGKGAQPILNPSLSLAYPATFSGTTVTVKLKNYKWSNGTAVTAQDVVFWLNMLAAVPQDWGLGTGFPQDVHDITVVSPTELTMVMDKAYNPTWFQYNELSQITPMPAAWDRTASGPSNCDITISDCAAVYNYLNSQAQGTGSYATSPIWQIVDGPWHLSAFNSDGHMTFEPNKSYSGPVKPKLAAFSEVPFTTDSAEYDVLQAANSSTKVDYGYLPPEDAPDKPAGATTGANPLHGYTLAPLYAFGIDYYSINEQASTGNAPILKQLYFREAMAYLTNQEAVIKGPLRGYGVPTVGPVGSTPATEFLSSEGKSQTASGVGPFPFSVAKAKALLTSHGWKVVPGGTSTCVDPAKCGPGIAAGKTLSFVFPYASGVSWITSMMAQLQSNSAQVGIKLNLEPKPAAQVGAGGNCVVGKIPCTWDMAYYGNGWTFSPDFLPTGDTLFMCGAVANIGGYCSQANDALIQQTLTSSNLQDMYTWQDYLAQQLPEIWAPDAAAQLTEIASNLKGALPQSSTLSINPENWYFVK
jgi:peptide/nickel transport system substrate-binding protein